MMETALKTYLTSRKISNEAQMSIAIANPIKIGSPPIAGVWTVCIFLPPGSSKKFLLLKNLMNTGNIKNVKRKEVPVMRRVCSIL